MKVSYLKEWDKDGTTYAQTIRIKMDEDSLIHLNKKLADIRAELKYHQLVDGHEVVPENIKWLDYGKNHLTITEFVVLKRLFGWDMEKRVLDGRNTILLLEYEPL